MCHAERFEHIREPDPIMTKVIHRGVDEAASLNRCKLWLPLF